VQLATIAVWISSLYGLVETGGHHIIYLSPDVLVRCLRLTFFVGILINYPNVLVKISIAIMLLRIKTTKVWRIAIYSLLASLVFVGVMSTIITLLYCKPISAFWSLTDRSTHCWSAKNMAVTPVIWYCKRVAVPPITLR
jgi:hypothetical protein